MDSSYASKPNLDTKKPVGNGVSTPRYMDGVPSLAKTMTADMTNSSTSLNTTASVENRSKKFKNPQVKQDTGLMYSDQE